MYRIRVNYAFTLPFVVYWVTSEGEELLESESLVRSDAYDYIREQGYNGKIELIEKE